MANISILSRVIAGINRQVDLSTNTLVVDILKVGGGSGTDLTKTILDNLVSLQNGTDFADGTNSHTHDGRYFTETELGSATSSSGSDLVGDDATYSNFTPTAATVKGALSGIDSALASAAFANQTLSNLTSPTAVNQNLSPDSDNFFTLGTPSKRWGELHVMSISSGSSAFGPYINTDLGRLIDSSGNSSLFWETRGLYDGLSVQSVDWNARQLINNASSVVFDWYGTDPSLNSHKLTNVADPTSSQDAVTLSYMNARLAGIKPKAAVKAATTATGTLATAFANGSVVDGVTLVTGDRILIKDQSTASENGIYIVNVSGAPTRATDFDSTSPIDEINGAWVSIQEGTANAGKIYVQFGVVATVGTDDINFEYFNPIAGLIGGDMITFAGSIFSVDLATVSGLESSNPGNVAGQLRIKLEASNPTLKFTGSNELALKMDAAGALASGASGVAVQVDNSTIEINTNALRVKDAGITLAKMASNSVDENKIVSTTFSSTGAITGGSGTKVAVAVDASSIEINTNALRIKSTAYDQATITGGSGTAASVQQAPLTKKTLVAGESFAANTSFLVRWGINSLTETTARVYKADQDSTSTDKFWVIGVALSTSAVSAGQNIDVVILGEYTLGSGDTAFNAADVGTVVWLTAAGAFSVTAPSTTGYADFKVGIVEATNKIWVDRQMMGVA